MASSIYLVRLGVETSMALSFSSILFRSSSIFCCAAVGIVCYVLSRLIGDAAALREENDMTI